VVQSERFFIIPLDSSPLLQAGAPHSDDLSPPPSDCRFGLQDMTQSESRGRVETKVSWPLQLYLMSQLDF
jgi:hypothetical protein